MLTNYKQKCENFVKEWIKTNTRYELNDIVLDDYKDFVVDFSVEVINQFSVECSKTTRKGSVTSGDEMYYKEAKYQSAIQEHIAREFDSKKNFQHLIDKISQGNYGKYDELSIIDKGDTLLYEYKCDECRGNGEVKCHNCKAGQIKCNASGCRNGKIEKTRQVNGKSQKYYENCSKCRGSGFITCSRCRGTAWIKCENCNATGFLTEVCQILMVTNPQYKIIYPNNIDSGIKEAIERHCNNGINYPYLNSITNISRESLKQSSSKKYVWEKYNAKIPFAKFSILFDDKKFTWFIYGTDLQIYENSGMLNVILANDINALVKIASQSSVTNIMILKNSKVAVANFMESAINQQIITSDSANKGERIDERVKSILSCVDELAEAESGSLLLSDFDTSRETSKITIDNAKHSTSVSNDYIKQTIQAFDKIAKDFCMGITCISSIVAFIISLILALTILPYGVFSPLIIFPLFIFCSTMYKELTFKKCWGEKLFNWVEKREIIKTECFLYTLIGEAIIFTIAYCVNIQNNVDILDMF